MLIGKKLEYVMIHLSGISSHDDAPKSEVIEALARVRNEAEKAIAEVEARRATEEQAE